LVGFERERGSRCLGVFFPMRNFERRKGKRERQ